MRIFYNHYSEVNEWFWSYFTPKEIASRGDGSILVDYEALNKLERARILARKPFVINSAYRDPIHNARVGGAPLSSHKEGHAFDVSLHNHDREELIQICKKAGFTGFGVNYKSFLHLDCGRRRQW